MAQETKQSKSPENTEKKHDTRFKKGQSGNPDGRPKGSKNFTTLMDEAVKQIADANKITTGEVWQVLIKRGYSEAKDGNYLFYRDILDRYFGKPVETFRGDPNSPLLVQISKEIADKNDIDAGTKNNSDRPA